jgi:hypothetical protein
MTFSFSDHVALLDQFLTYRSGIVERIEESLLNVREKETARRRDRSYFDGTLNECFFAAPGLDRDLSRLKGQLAAAHLADGFEPLQLEGFSNEFDSLDLIIRAYEYWDAHRWPGKSGRLAYAQSIYSAFILRQLEGLSMRMWDERNDRAGDRLQAIQNLLDSLNGPAAQQVFVRDVRWLVQTAQGPLTKHLEPYFRIATHISESFTEPVRLGLHASGAKLAGGHLRSQLRYRALENNQQIDGPVNLAIARNSNSMDVALLVRDLVALLKAYESFCVAQDANARLETADAILQGLSADPELLLVRLDLLGPCTMIEDLFVERGGDGRARYTSLGRAHVAILDQYRELICRLAGNLKIDVASFAPPPDTYSPYGISYGFAADLLSNIALDTLVTGAIPNLTFEDMFASRGGLNAKLERARAWADLPKREGERDHFYHSAEFAAHSFARLTAALDARVARKTGLNVSNYPDARLYVVAESESADAPHSDTLPEGALPAGVAHADEYCYTSNLNRALSGGMTAVPKDQMLIDRNEGRYLASVERGGDWFAVSKVILTLFLSQGKDALISGVPQQVIEVLHLTCPGLIATAAGNGRKP